MAKRPILGLYEDANAAADAGDALKAGGIDEQDYDFLTDSPYPEGAFGEREEKHDPDNGVALNVRPHRR